MKFKKAVVQNFLSYGPEVVIPLDIKGITLISGRVVGSDKYESNSAGKSTVLSAVTYALWGETVYKEKADDVINNVINKDCKVHLYLEDDGTNIEIIRFRKLSTSNKPDDLLLIVNGKDISGANNTITQQNINQIIGIDFDIFKALNPGCGVEVASLTDSEIKVLLEAILKTSELSTAYKIANERYNKLNKEKEIKNIKLNNLNKSLDNANKLKEQYKINKEEFDNTKQREIDDLLSEASIACLEVNELKSIDLDSIIKTIKSQEKHSKSLYASLETHKSEEVVLKEKLHKADLIFTRESSNITSKIDDLKKSITKITNMQGDGQCPACLSTISHDHVIEATNSCQLSITLLENKLNKLIKANKKIIDGIKSKLNEVIDLKTQYEGLLSLHVPHLNSNIAIYNDLKTKKETLPAKTRAHEFLCDKLLEAQKKRNTFQDLYDREENNTLVLQQQIKVLQEELISDTETLAILDFWVKSFSPSGIRSYMIETVIPFLNEQVKYYSDILTSGEMSVIFSTKSSQKSGKIVEKFSIEVSQKHGSKRFRGSSKGEKARANLVISLALGALASLRASKKLSFRLFDEVFDCIDGVGCEAVYNLLTQCLNQYETIYVITHKEDFKEMFNSNIIVQKINGFSSLVLP